MPFQTTATPPRTNPRVTISFSGLMVLQPGDNNTCEVGIHRFNTSHECRVTLVTRRPNRPPSLLSLLKGPLEAPFSVGYDVDPNPGIGDFAVFAPTPEPFVRDAPSNHVLDYRWAVNIKERHPNVDLNAGAQPFVTLKTGILYTPNLTRIGMGPNLINQEMLNASQQPIQLHRIASNLAVSIITTGTRKVRLKWRDFGNEIQHDIPNDNDPVNTTYTVAFTNEPVKINAEAHDEMALYYRILNDGGAQVADRQQFTLQYTAIGRTDEVPCLALTKSP